MLRFVLLAAVLLHAGCGSSGLGEKKIRKSGGAARSVDIPREQIDEAQDRLTRRLDRIHGLLSSLEGMVGAMPDEEREEIQPQLSELTAKHDAILAEARALPETNGTVWRKTHSIVVEDVRQLESSVVQFQANVRGQ